MTTVMENFQHFTQDCPNAEGHLLVALPGQPLDRFEVTEVTRQGTSLVLQCQPVEKGNDSEPPSPGMIPTTCSTRTMMLSPCLAMILGGSTRICVNNLTTTTLLSPPASGMWQG